MAAGRAGAMRAFRLRRAEFLGFHGSKSLHLFQYTTVNPVWGHTAVLHMMGAFPASDMPVAMPAHSDGVSVTLCDSPNRTVIEDEHDANSRSR
jgi:hypothetical protein